MNKNSKTLEAIWVALNSIAYRIYSKKGEEGISLLINQNMDYIVDQISRRISCSCKQAHMTSKIFFYCSNLQHF